LQINICASVQALNPLFDSAPCRNDDHADIRADIGQEANSVQSIAVWQAQVKHHHIDRLPRRLKGLEAGQAANALAIVVNQAMKAVQIKVSHHRLAQLCEANNLLCGRKVVEHAKAILMRARHLSDDDAFRMLRIALMHSNQRLAEVSGHIIHSACFADDVNRSGQTKPRPQR